MDLEASPEAMTRGTVRHADHLLLIAEPYFKSMETARRYHELGTGLGIPRVSVVANKVRPADEEILAEYCDTRGFELIATIPFEPAFQEAERLGIAPFDHASGSPGAEAIARLADIVMEQP
jgi:CO dehydrogenase maturation factor